ncbi:EmrB/QacA subfamily drug resistance transporter [Streptomyces sp. V4I23]|uniref:MDR family MFS transporter n=1 Tax=Streptomyces sp. V4I23 TaxID=3042282 RepID=UPI0027847539|nr:MDR family MFS transporter [Streptomyces sp. V4I23]MDQ1008549.1 EmrB/QacA subfamily drug resistance transporter [Streptomyces sp. V4I23]
MDPTAANRDTASRPQAERLDPALIRLGSVLILGAVLAQLDATIVNVGLGPVAEGLDTSMTTVQWVSAGYLLTVAFVAPLSGWLQKRYGGKRVWLAAVALFIAASALSGLAWSGSSLIAFRLLQGVGGGLMQPVGQSLVARHAGPKRIGRLVGIITVPVSVAPILGPVVGGVLVQWAGWRWLFLVNIPVALIALALAARIVPADTAERDTSVRPDGIGLTLLPTGLAALVYGLSQYGPSDGLGQAVALAVGVAFLSGYVLHALRTTRTPLLDLRLFAGRGFALAGINTFLLGAALYSSMMLLPLYFMQVKGVGAFQAGLMLAPQALGSALITPLAGRLTDRYGPRNTVLAGIALTVLGTLPFTLATGEPGELLLVAALFVRGIGLGAVVPPNVAATYTSVDRNQAPAATSARTVLNRIGGSVGTAALAVILQSALADAERHGAGAASAYAHTFWWALAFSALTLLPAALYPRHAPGKG